MKNQKIEELITYDNIMSYSKACIELRDTLISKEDEFKLLIIPSRGAYPFYSFSQKATYYRKSGIERVKSNIHYNKWFLPYTADWGGEKANIQTDSKTVRFFWSKVLYDSIQKKVSPYTLFYENTIDVLKDKLTFNSGNCFINLNKKTDKFIFIDTAISGRAICEIMDSFDDLNIINYFIILLIDKSGGKLEKEYKSKIIKKEHEGRLKPIYVDNIFTEDSSPIMNGGISTVVFPSLIERASREIPEFKIDSNCGAGLWFIDSMSHLHGTKLNGVRGAISYLIHLGIRAHFDDINAEAHLLYYIGDLAKGIIKNLEDYNIFDQQKTEQLITNRIKKKNSNFKYPVKTSSSHVVRMQLDNKIISKIIKQSKK